MAAPLAATFSIECLLPMGGNVERWEPNPAERGLFVLRDGGVETPGQSYARVRQEGPVICQSHSPTSPHTLPCKIASAISLAYVLSRLCEIRSVHLHSNDGWSFSAEAWTGLPDLSGGTFLKSMVPTSRKKPRPFLMPHSSFSEITLSSTLTVVGIVINSVTIDSFPVAVLLIDGCDGLLRRLHTPWRRPQSMKALT